MKRLMVLVFVLPLMLAISEAPGSANEALTKDCNADYCARCDSAGGLCVQHSNFCDCHVT